jgi:ABC-type transporter Mla subunit MlaD
MNITTIEVSAARCFNNPRENYSNLQPRVTMQAEIIAGEDPIAAVKELQLKAEQLVEDHKQNLLRSIEELYQLTERQAEMRGLQKTLKAAQDRLDDIRKAHPDLKLIGE